jgi:hypothetical protein
MLSPYRALDPADEGSSTWTIPDWVRRQSRPRGCVSRARRPPAAWPGPEIGQHNEHVPRELISLTDGEITELVIDKELE